MTPHLRRTPYRELLQVIVGEGGQSLESYWHLRSLKMAEWILRGVQRRRRPFDESVRNLAQAIGGMMGCKGLPDYFPFPDPFPWEQEQKRDLSDAGLAAERQNAEAVLDAMIKRQQKQ